MRFPKERRGYRWIPIFWIDIGPLLAYRRGPPKSVLSYLFHGKPGTMLARAVFLIALIALVDWRVETNVSLGFLYLFPMLMVGVSLRRWQIAVCAALCTFL